MFHQRRRASLFDTPTSKLFKRPTSAGSKTKTQKSSPSPPQIRLNNSELPPSPPVRDDQPADILTRKYRSHSSSPIPRNKKHVRLELLDENSSSNDRGVYGNADEHLDGMRQTRHLSRRDSVESKNSRSFANSLGTTRYNRLTADESYGSSRSLTQTQLQPQVYVTSERQRQREREHQSPSPIRNLILVRRRHDQNYNAGTIHNGVQQQRLHVSPSRNLFISVIWEFCFFFFLI